MNVEGNGRAGIRELHDLERRMEVRIDAMHSSLTRSIAEIRSDIARREGAQSVYRWMVPVVIPLIVSLIGTIAGLIVAIRNIPVS